MIEIKNIKIEYDLFKSVVAHPLEIRQLNISKIIFEFSDGTTDSIIGNDAEEWFKQGAQKLVVTREYSNEPVNKKPLKDNLKNYYE